jgi:hypothetical protein
MAIVFRIESMAGATYDFSEMEVGKLEEWNAQQQLKLESQCGDPTIFDMGVEHYRARCQFINAFASTVARLNLVRVLADRFWMYPHYLFDTDLKYCVVLWNPEAIKEFWYHGHPEADKAVTLEFREFVGFVCYPPVPGS